MAGVTYHSLRYCWIETSRSQGLFNSTNTGKSKQHFQFTKSYASSLMSIKNKESTTALTFISDVICLGCSKVRGHVFATLAIFQLVIRPCLSSKKLTWRKHNKMVASKNILCTKSCHILTGNSARNSSYRIIISSKNLLTWPYCHSVA